MDPIRATWMVKIVAREIEGDPIDEAIEAGSEAAHGAAQPPTNTALEEAVAAYLGSRFPDLTFTASAERTDR